MFYLKHLKPDHFRAFHANLEEIMFIARKTLKCWDTSLHWKIFDFVGRKTLNSFQNCVSRIITNCIISFLKCMKPENKVVNFNCKKNFHNFRKLKFIGINFISLEEQLNLLKKLFYMTVY